ncbi:MAG: class I SAM-dependent methyltransferase [Stellaceae bacterium]
MNSDGPAAVGEPAPFASLIRALDKLVRSNGEIRDAVVNQSALLNIKFGEIIGELRNEQRIINDKLNKLIKSNDNFAAAQSGIDNGLSAISGMVESIPLLLESGQHAIETKFNELIAQLGLVGRTMHTAPRGGAQRNLPLLRAPKTYNTDHPDYDPLLARNFPDTLLNGDKPSVNPALRAVRTIMLADQIDERAWTEQLQLALAEVNEVPGADQLFERKAKAERFFQEASSRYHAHYNPGWVNLGDGLFIYWLVRRLRPRTLVQTGIANGLSSGLILLALAKNGNGGRLHAIGHVNIFDAEDPWRRAGTVFDEVVVDRESLGWMVPDNCRGALDLHDGDAKTLLPEIVSKLDSIDVFFHNSDHSYDQMMFEFQEAKRKLSAPSIVVADKIAGSSSLWDFADNHGVPAYNFRGSVGAAFFG